MLYGKGQSPTKPSFRFPTNAVSRAPIWALANGPIYTTSQSGVNGGVYNTSVEMEIYLTPIEIVESVPINVPNLPTCGVSPLP
jgi:hypothetical protein